MNALQQEQVSQQTATINQRACLTRCLSFQTGTSVKLIDLVDSLQVLSRIKDVCIIFRVFLAILRSWA